MVGERSEKCNPVVTVHNRIPNEWNEPGNPPFPHSVRWDTPLPNPVLHSEGAEHFLIVRLVIDPFRRTITEGTMRTIVVIEVSLCSRPHAGI